MSSTPNRVLYVYIQHIIYDTALYGLVSLPGWLGLAALATHLDSRANQYYRLFI
jgi:hypothetical protein